MACTLVAAIRQKSKWMLVLPIVQLEGDIYLFIETDRGSEGYIMQNKLNQYWGWMRCKLCSCQTFCNSCWDGVRTTVPAAAVFLSALRSRPSLFCIGCNPCYLTALVTIVEPDQYWYLSPRVASRRVHVRPIIHATHRIIPLDIPCILLRIQVFYWSKLWWVGLAVLNHAHKRCTCTPQKSCQLFVVLISHGYGFKSDSEEYVRSKKGSHGLIPAV